MTIVSDATTWIVTYDCHSDDPRGVIYAVRVIMLLESSVMLLESSVMLLESSVMLLESSVMLLEPSIVFYNKYHRISTLK